MVGVPGRSQACKTCRKRKIGFKCDLQRPNCGQCQKYGVKCEGYARQQRFVNATLSRPSPVTGESSISISTSASSYQVISSNITLPTTLARSAYEEKYTSLFWNAYLPGTRLLPPATVRNTLASWTNMIQDRCRTDDVLRKAFLAICLGTIGRQDRDQWMVEKGLELYAGALSDMSAVLAVPKRAKARVDELWTASKLFSLYEAMHGADDEHRNSQANSWAAHCSGEMALVTSRSPEEYMFGYAHQLFVHGRLHLSISAILARKKCPLSGPEWMTIPWLHHPKSLRDTLLDILIEIPTLYEEIDLMNELSMSSTSFSPSLGNSSEGGKESKNKKHERRQNEIQVLRQVLIARSWDLDKRLQEWYESVPLPREQAIPTSYPYFDNEKTKDKDTKNGFGKGEFEITVEQLALTHLFTLYWATCILLYAVMPEVLRLEQSADTLKDSSINNNSKAKYNVTPSPTPRFLLILPARMNLRRYIRHLIQTVPIFLDPSIGIFRVHLSTFPLGVVAREFKRLDEEKEVYINEWGRTTTVRRVQYQDGDDDNMTKERKLLRAYFETEGARGIRKFVTGLPGGEE